MSVEIGFLEKADDPLCSPFVSKVGGFPAWLIPDTIPRSESLQCKICLEPLIYLLQVYAPDDLNDDAYHKVVYVFTCRNGKCHQRSAKDCFVVLRCQLPRNNKYYPEESDDEATEISPPTVPICCVCGIAGNKRCSKCLKATYCSRSHQLYHWNSQGHKSSCSSNSTTLLSPPNSPSSLPSTISDDTFCTASTSSKVILSGLLFPEYEIVSEPEDIEAFEKMNQDLELKYRKLFENASNAGVEGHTEEDPDGGYEETQGIDKAFLKFQQRVELSPDQVLRYARVENNDQPAPLWVSALDQPKDDEIPKCEHCQSPRTFEFQVMPQLLNFLSLDSTDVNALDWGTLLIYSCSQSCKLGTTQFGQEVLWRQMFSPESIHPLKE